MQIAVLLFDRFTALDAIGPAEVLSRLPGAELCFVAEQAGPYRTDTGSLAAMADRALDEVPRPDVLLVPGGPGTAGVTPAGPTHDWLREADQATQWTTSVCTGSLILAEAGLLSGRRAATHWLATEELERLGTHASHERVTFDGKFATAAGVSAGIDMALALAARIAGEQVAQEIQLWIEYDPQPPFDAGSPAKAPAPVLAAAQSRSRFRRAAAPAG